MLHSFLLMLAKSQSVGLFICMCAVECVVIMFFFCLFLASFKLYLFYLYFLTNSQSYKICFKTYNMFICYTKDGFLAEYT